MINSTMILILGGGLGLLLLLAGVVVSLVDRRSVVDERLGRYSESGGLISASSLDEAEQKKNQPSAFSIFLDRLGEGTDLYDAISHHLSRADVKFRPSEYLMLIVTSCLGMGLVGTFLGRSIGFGILSAILGVFVPPLYIMRLQKKRLKLFDNQLGDMLNLMVNGLRAGYSTLQAMEAVSKELPPPVSDEFRRVVQEIQLGISIEDALDHLLERIISEDLDLVITAITVQREVGGNLSEILDVISYTIRERVRIKGEIAALTAQGRATAWIISAMPVVLSVLLYFINREYIMSFFNPATRTCGIPMLVLGVLMIIAGFVIVMKMVQIDI